MHWLSIIALASVIYIIFFFGWAFRTTNKSRTDLMNRLAGILDSSWRDLKGSSSDKHLYCTFDNREFEVVFIISQPFSERMREEIHIKTRIKTDFGLKFLIKSGNSMIGRTADQLRAICTARGLQEINTTGLSNIFQRVRIYTDHTEKAKNVLRDSDFIRVFSKYCPLIFLDNDFIVVTPDLRKLYAKPDLIVTCMEDINLAVERIERLGD